MGGYASLLSRGLLAAALLLLAAGGASAQERVGVNTAVNPEATGTPPGAAARKLVIGQDVIFNEHITTGPIGQTQLLFLDESAMTVGPNSDLTIDQFVYDPKSGTGKLAMSATRGLLRYVGGKLSKQDNAVTLHSTTATLAVRGGAFILNVGPSCGAGVASAGCGTSEAIFIFGDGLTVTGRNGTAETLLRPGYAITIGAGGQLSAPFAVPPQTLAAFLQELNGRQGSSGGATVVPTDAAFVASGLPTTIAGIAPPVPATTIAAAQQILSQISNSSQTFNPQPNSAGQIVTTCTTQGCSSSFAAPVNKPPSEPGFAGRVKNTNGRGTATGFVDQTANGDVAYSGGSLSNGKFTAQVGGSLGTISFPLVPGTSSFGPNNTSSGLGSFTGSSFLSADGTFFYARLTPTSQPSERLFITGGTAVNSSFYDPTGATRLFAFTIQPDAALNSNIPFVRPQAGGNLVNAAVSPLYVVAPPATKIGDASTVSAARALQGSLAIDGNGADQRSTIAVTTGTIDTLQSSKLPILNGAMRGSSLQSATPQASNTGTPVRLSSAVSSMVDANGNGFYGAGTITGFGLDQTAFSGGSTTGTVGSPVIPSTASEVPLSGSATNYGFAQAATAASVPSGVGATRTTRTLSGNFGGLMYSSNQTTPYILAGGATISTDATNNRVQATLSGSAQSASSGVSTVTMQYGGLTGDAGGRQAFVDDNTFAALESQSNPQQINGQTLVVNGDSTQAGKLYLASAGVAMPPASLLTDANTGKPFVYPAGTPNAGAPVTYCQCQYLQWGYWGGDLLTGNSTDSGISRIDRGHINTWVAGVPTPLNDLNSLQSISATANYAGHAFGSVFNNGASYLAAGGFNGTYNFGTQVGSFTISNFDGRTFSGSGKVPLSGANYTFAMSGAGFKGGGSGTFYGPNAAETGGNFAVQSTVGPTYMASGIYAGKQ